MYAHLPVFTEADPSAIETFPPGFLVVVIIGGFLLAGLLTLSVKVGKDDLTAGVGLGAISTILVGTAAFFTYAQSSYNEERKAKVEELTSAGTSPEVFTTPDFGLVLSPTILFTLVILNVLIILIVLFAEPEVAIGFLLASMFFWAAGFFLMAGFDEAPSRTELFTTWLSTHYSELEIGSQASDLLNDRPAYAVNGDTYRLVPMEHDDNGDAFRLLRLNDGAEVPVPSEN